ncbi:MULTISPECIES: hypothetical protein [Nocardia]|uniref:hypothetical protein n=1 Tax=Nocardia TaxID=1817 RepID=UPI000D68EB87|nr:MULTISPECIES: hypothetical protein [Nocardia]
MTEFETEDVRYGIEQPDGVLASSRPNRDTGKCDYKRLPNDAYAYLWSNPEDAEANRVALADEIGYGAGELFEQHTRVVEVRVTTRMTVRPVAPTVEAEVAEVSEPRTWQDAREVPADVIFRSAGFDPSPSWHKLPCGEFFQFSADPAKSRPVMHEDINRVWGSDYGFVEVLPDVETSAFQADGAEDPKPRTWAKAEKVPMGVRFAAAVDGSEVWERVDSSRALKRMAGGTIAETLAELNADHPDGFIEVLP